MDIGQLFSAQNILQATAIGVVVAMVRKILELKWSKLIGNRVWTGVVLPTAALFLSVSASYVLASPFTATDAFNGVLCGFASSYVFSILKTFLNKEANIKDSIPPEKSE